MQTAGYTSNINGRYPLSTQTLDFIQSQVLLLQQLGFIGGSRYMLRTPDGTHDGLAFVDGELLTVAATPAYTSTTKYLIVTETTEDITADGDTYTEARRYRTARLSVSAQANNCYNLSAFQKFLTNTALNEKIEQVPQMVLNYLSDVLASKMPLLTIDNMTKEQLDGIVTPCVANCRQSIRVVSDAPNYSLFVTKMGIYVRQEITVPNGDKYFRMRQENVNEWSRWERQTESLHIEVKIDHGTVYLRHGELPADTSIVLLRKKKRSAYRRTGGGNSYSKNVGKRVSRMPKTQYVHFKGIVLSKGTPNQWYVPRCIHVANGNVDSDCLNKEIAGCCRRMVSSHGTDPNGNEVYRMQGVRNWITNTNGAHRQHQAYAKIAVQVVRLNQSDTNTSKQAGGEMVKLRYWLRRKKVKVTPRYTCNNCGYVQSFRGTCAQCRHTSWRDTSVYTYTFYRTVTFD